MPYTNFSDAEAREIAGLAPDNQIIPLRHEQWENAFPAEFELIKKLVPSVMKNRISRFEVTQIGRGTLEFWEHDHTSIRSFFVAVMMWGYGRVGYGPFRVALMLESEATADILRCVSTYIQFAASAGKREDYASAYTYIRNAYLLGKSPSGAGGAIPRCGPPFFTKFVYFLGLTFGTCPLPLILDRRVATAIDQRDPGVMQDYARVNAAAWYPDGYMRYITEANTWCEQHAVRPDSLEMYLWQKG